MPVKSEKQRRAMYAALHGKSTIGISPSVAKKFVGPEAHDDADLNDTATPHVAGTLFMLPDGRVLLLRRSDEEKNFAGHWSIPGGNSEPGETPEQTARRESFEEMGEVPDGDDVALIATNQTPTGKTFYTFGRIVDKPFVPTLNDEHTRYAWAKIDDLPEPMHPAVMELLQNLQVAPKEEWDVKGAQDSFAFDRESVRSYDADKRLHVSVTPISKANICEYYGREIPDAQRLGLDPDRKYKLLRDPEELKKAVATFNNLPLLRRHVPVSANDHKPEDVIGSTGTDASFEEPYLTNSIVVWSKDDIDDIEKGVRKELSSAYRYRADMQPGIHEGDRYDGVMRDIVGNHVAVVKEGRAGPDVVVGDSKPEGGYAMANKFAMDNQPQLSATSPNGGIPAMGRFRRANDEWTPEQREKYKNNSSGDKPTSPRHEQQFNAAHGHLEKHGWGMAPSSLRGSPGISPEAMSYQHKEHPGHEIHTGHSFNSNVAWSHHSPDKTGGNGFGAHKLKEHLSKFHGGGAAHDSKPKELTMAKTVLTRKAMVAKGALVAFLLPQLAEDAGIDLDPALKGITNKNYVAKRPKLLEDVTALVDGKLATDGKIDGLDDVLMALDEMDAPEPVPAMVPGKGDKKAKDAAGEGLKGMLKDKLTAKDWKAACDDIDGLTRAEKEEERDEEEAEAEDEDDDDNHNEDLRPDPERTNRATDARRRAKDAEPMMTKKDADKAMDEAIKGERTRQRDIREAEVFVRPWVGDLNLAFDSADDVYKKALELRGKKDLKSVHPSAFRSILELLPKPGTEHRGSPRLAADAAAVKGFSDRYPEATRIKTH